MNNFMRILKYRYWLFGSLWAIFMMSSCRPKPVNAIQHPSFDDNGYLLDTLSQQHFVSEIPGKVKFYVEVSGSMNGFFRSNKATQFKSDVWSIFSVFEELLDDVYVFERQNVAPKGMPLQTFRQKMNTGAFVSSASTEVPEMLEAVINSLDIQNEEIAVLVSDMKYSPVGSKAMEVRLVQYASDIRNLVMKNPGLALSLVVASSDYMDKSGTVVCHDSPYYYLIVGKPENVVWIKNRIATILKDSIRYVDAIDWGIDFKSPAFSLGTTIINGFQLGNEPTITNIDWNFMDTCFFDIIVDLKDYPWKLVDEKLLKDSLHIKSIYSNVEIDTVFYQIDNHADKQLKREAKATVKLKVFNMFSDAEVIEWSIGIPETDPNNKFASFFGAKSENELDKSFSIESFIEGCSAGKSNYWCKEPNRILLSTNKQ